MTSRTIQASWRRELEKQQSAEAPLAFVAITHEQLETPLRFVSVAGVDHVWSGATYYGIGFDWQLLTDDDQPPRSALTLENVDRRAGRYVRDLLTPPRVRIDILLASDFDETTDPRTAIGTPSSMYTANHLFLTDVSFDGLSLTGNLQSWDYRQTSWPAIRATQSRTPGLYR